jgi:hypothetical protein
VSDSGFCPIIPVGSLRNLDIDLDCTVVKVHEVRERYPRRFERREIGIHMANIQGELFG